MRKGQQVALASELQHHVLSALELGDDLVQRGALQRTLDEWQSVDQSQFAGAVLSTARLRRKAADHVPHLSEDGHLRRRTLELMDGRTSLAEIAHRLASEFPERFPRWERALSYAAEISGECSR